jgi:hypothetical protein
MKHFANSKLGDIIIELKYRILYSSLLIVTLMGLIYLNLGLHIEFQGSYYLNYYQFIDFNWFEGVNELNENKAFPDSFKPQADDFNASNMVSFFKPCFTKVMAVIGGMENPVGPNGVPPLLKSSLFFLLDFHEPSSEVCDSYRKPLPRESLGFCNKLLLFIKINLEGETITSTLLGTTLLHSFFSQILNFCGTTSLEERQNERLDEFSRELQNIDSINRFELDEYSPFFISTISFFSGHAKLFLKDIYCWGATNLNTLLVFNNQNIFTSLSNDRLTFLSFYFIFYQLSAILSYHCFTFWCPAITQQSRLKLFMVLQICAFSLQAHFLTLPYLIAVLEELQIESIDSELLTESDEYDIIAICCKTSFLLNIFLFLFLNIIVLVANSRVHLSGNRLAYLPNKKK